jgi:hypothetical protein
MAGCGDNIHPAKDGGPGDDSNQMDGPVDAPPDATILPDGACPSGDNICSGVCSNPNTDDHNCGGCGNDCTTSGQMCSNGICCPSGQVNTGGICCTSGQINSNGHCCNSGETYDNGICCPSGQFNAGGSAAPLCCNVGQSDCGGACVNELTDNNHCGDCTTTCNVAGGEQCSNGHCCASPDIYCSGVCTNPNTDMNNCGSCGNTCTGTDLCSSGKCCPLGEFNDSGLCCPLGQHNSGGICCDAGSDNTGGICCPTGDSNCSGACVNEQSDKNHCGSCSTACTSSQSCVAGQCCATGDNVCGGVCSDPGTDNKNCGACGNDCTASGNLCSSGLCCPAGTINTGGICCVMGQFNIGGICCNNATDSNCGGACVNELTDRNHCGSCTNACPGGDSCTSGTCCPTGDILCNGACSNSSNDDTNCGGCAGAGGTNCTLTGKSCSNGICCAPGTSNSGGICCPSGQQNSGGICCPINQTNCGGTCVNELTDNNHCGSCTTVCIAPKVCDGTGTCNASCGPGTMYCAGTNTCSDVSTDNANCGTCGHACTGGQTCVGGTCGCNTAPFITNCSGTCTDLTQDTNNCGTCGTACAPGQLCDQTATAPPAICCDLGLSVCGTSCANLSSDNNNCGFCGNVCGSGSTCTNGSCACPFGEVACGGGGCKAVGVDPGNCGACGNVCGVGANAGKPYCVSNSCVATCPAPLCGTGSGATAQCINPQDDNKHCGASGTCTGGTDCTATGKVCSAGSCVTGVSGGNLAKCVNGGPPIVVPGSGGKTDCAGNLAGTSFTFGLCSCTDIGPLSRQITEDAFDSSLGAYHGPGFAGTACTTAADCAKECSVTHQPCVTAGVQSDCPAGETCSRFPIACVNGTCAGGGLGTNGIETDTADTDVGGDLWMHGAGGVSTKGNVSVYRRTYINGPLTYAKPMLMAGDAHIVGGFASQGSGTASVGTAPVNGDTGTLYEQSSTCGHCSVTTTKSCNGAMNCPGGETCIGSALPNSLALFGNPACVQQTVSFAEPCDCTPADLIPVKSIVQFYSNPANNDDAAAGLSPGLFDNAGGTIRLDLQCGYYYFHALQTSGTTVTIVVHGHVGLFFSGAVRISQNVIFDLDPTATLDIFVGGVMSVSQSTTIGSPAYPRYTRMYIGGASCTGGSGGCSVNEDCCGGVCTGGACVGGGGNLGQAISLSNSGSFNGLLWAGYGTFTHSNPLEMYGAIFAGHFDASGTTTIHYDNGIVSAPNECPPPTGVCDTCADCLNNPCVLGQCQANCTSDGQCCPPLHCVGTPGVCQL